LVPRERGALLLCRTGLSLRMQQCPARLRSLPRLQRGGCGTGARYWPHHITEWEETGIHMALNWVVPSLRKGTGLTRCLWSVDDPGFERFTARVLLCWTFWVVPRANKRCAVSRLRSQIRFVIPKQIFHIQVDIQEYHGKTLYYVLCKTNFASYSWGFFLRF